MTDLRRSLEVAKAFRSWQTLESVAARSGVSSRTVRRDLDALEAIGFTIVRRLQQHTASFKAVPPRRRLY